MLSKAFLLWGYSSVGRAFEWHSKGQRFETAYLHQIKFSADKGAFYLNSI